MSRRKPIQKQQERGVVALFLQWLKRRDGSSWGVDSEPDPPEAVISDGTRVRWVEVASVFPSDDYAHDAWSDATPGEEPFDTSGWIHRDVNANFAKRFVAVVEGKRRKETYLPFKQMYGAGILLLDLHSPWLTDRTMEAMEERWAKATWTGDLGCFSEFYLIYPGRQGLEIAEWKAV